MQAYIDSIQDEVGAEASPGSEDLDRARCPQYFFERAALRKAISATPSLRSLAVYSWRVTSTNNYHNR